MLKCQDLTLIFLQVILLATLCGLTTGASQAMDWRPSFRAGAPVLTLDSRVRWHEVEKIGPRCFLIQDVPVAGTLLLEVTTTVPATSPELVVFGPGQDGEDLTVLERVSGVLIQVHRAGEWVVCLTSQAPLGEVKLGSAFVPAAPGKGGDPLESEPDPEP